MSLFNYECDEVKRIIEEVSPNYPQLTTYEKEWIFFHKYHYIPGTPVELECQEVIVKPTGTVQNAIPYPYKHAILKGNTDENLQSVKMPVLTTSNEDGTKTNILTVNENVELRGIGEVKDELDLLTGELTQRIGEVVLDGSQQLTKWRNTTEQSNTLTWNITINNMSYNSNILSDKLQKMNTTSDVDKADKEVVATSSNNRLYIRLNKSRGLTEIDVMNNLAQNPIIIQYQLTSPNVKTVALTKLNKPYEGTNHYHLTANIPCEAILEVPVVSTGEQTLQEINND